MKTGCLFEFRTRCNKRIWLCVPNAIQFFPQNKRKLPQSQFCHSFIIDNTRCYHFLLRYNLDVSTSHKNKTQINSIYKHPHTSFRYCVSRVLFLKMSYTFKDVDGSLAKKASFTGTTKFVHVGIDSLAKTQLPFPPQHHFADCFLPKQFENIAERVRSFEVRPDDIWLVSFPKCGSTWLHNIVWQLMIKKLDLTSEPFCVTDSLFLERHTVFNEPTNDLIKERMSQSAKTIDTCDATPSPRIIKSHLPVHLLPTGIWTVKPKIIYIARNPKDTAISFYHMHRNGLSAFSGTKEDYFEKFMLDGVLFAPFHDHVLNYWEIHHLENLLFLTYEDLSANRFAGIKRISEFLGCTYSDEKLHELTAYVSFDHMTQNQRSFFKACNQDKDFK